MSTAAGAPPNGANTGVKSPQRNAKGKGKEAIDSLDVSMEEDEEEDDDEDDDEDEDDDDDDDDPMEYEDEEDEEDPEIDPSAIVSRRTRGIKVDYTSKEALEKAGLAQEEGKNEKTK